MRFFLSSMQRAESGARAMKAVLAKHGHEAMHTRCQHAVAIALGYASWPELKSVTRAAAQAASPLDHEAGDRDLVDERLRQHAAAIADVFKITGPESLEIAVAVGLTAPRNARTNERREPLDAVPAGAGAAEPTKGIAFEILDEGSGTVIRLSGAMLTAAGGLLELRDNARAVCGLLEDGTFLVSKAHQFNPHVLSLRARARQLGCKIDKTMPVSLATIKEAYRLAPASPGAAEARIQSSTREAVSVASTQDPADSFDRMQSMIKQMRDDGRRLIEAMVARAEALGSAIVQIMWQEQRCVVHCRVAGNRVCIHEGDAPDYRAMSTFIRNTVAIDASEAAPYASGAFSIKTEHGERRSTVMLITTVGGEMMTLKFDDPFRRRLSVADLGLSGAEQWIRSLGQENGLYVVAGATDCGRSTTLGVIVRSLEAAGRLVCYVGPESDRPSDTAVHIAPRQGNATLAVQAAMRFNADAIIIDEARDPKVVQDAVRAAGPDCLVVVGIHARDIRGSLIRLQDLGVGLEETTEVLRGVLVQSLVAKPGGTRFAACECALFDQKSRRVDEAIGGRTWWQSIASDKEKKLSAYAPVPGAA